MISFTIARKGDFKILELQHNTSGQATVRDLVGMSLLEYATRICMVLINAVMPGVRFLARQLFLKAL